MKDYIAEIKKQLNTEGPVKESIRIKVSADGNTLIYGDFVEEQVFIFIKEDGYWVYQQLLVAPELSSADGAVGDWFGWSVSLSSDGNTALIGAVYADPKSADSGAAYIYTRSGSTWTQQAKLFPADGVANGWFGYSVFISSDGTLAKAQNYFGKEYVFTLTDSVWGTPSPNQP